MAPDARTLDAIATGLARLDGLLGRLIAAQPAASASQTPDPFRGLYIGDEEVARLLARGPGGLALADADGPPLVDLPELPRWAGLAERSGLAALDVDALLLALAPEVDSRYERLYAYAQDDVTRRRPTLELLLTLRCHSAEARIAALTRWLSGSPLQAAHLVELTGDPPAPLPPLLSRALRLDDRMVHYLLGGDAIDAQLRGVARWLVSPPGEREMRLGADGGGRLEAVARESRRRPQPLMATLVGAEREQREAAASVLGETLGFRVLMVEVRALLELEGDPRPVVGLLRREALLSPALLYWEALDQLGTEGEEGRRLERLFDAIAGGGMPGLIGTAQAELPAAAARSFAGVTLELPGGSAAGRAARWRNTIRPEESALSDIELRELASTVRVGDADFGRAVTAAGRLASWRGGERPRIGREELLKSLRIQTGHVLRSVAARIEPKRRWPDLVLPADALTQLRELTHRVLHRETVFQRWGFDGRLTLGRGVHALFAGPSGTGKTLAAEIIAGELGLPLYRLDVSRIVSKYIGDTERQLRRVFEEAAATGPILFFDEADALFGKRTEVKDAHDRYANIEVSYLLQAMEQYDGLTILATNMRQNMDDAMVRRLSFAVTFPFPEPEDRLRLWQQAWPAETPVAEQVDRSFLARQFRLTGGNIRNVALAAAFAAAADGGVVTMGHVIRATRREFQKMGKAVSESEFGAHFGLLQGAAEAVPA